MNYETIKNYTEQGYSIAKIAKAENKSLSSIRYWLNKFGLKTKGRKRRNIPLCEFCNETIPQYRAPKRFCDTTCASQFRRTLSFQEVERGQGTARSIRKFLLQKHNACFCCGLSEWMGSKIPLEVDHIDGNSSNNEIENLRILCANCHAQTDTYKSKNRGNGRHYRSLRYKEGKSF